MDAVLLAALEEKKAEMLTDLGSDYTAVEFMGVALNVLAGADTQDIIDAATAKISKYGTVNQKSTLRDNVSDYYTYLLLNSLQNADMADVSAKYTTAQLKAVNSVMSERNADLMAKARRIGNYSMDVFMTEGELAALVDEAYKAVATPSLSKAEVEEMVKYQFYTAVVKNLNATAKGTFNMYEVYAGTLADSSAELKKLAKYFVVSFTNLSGDIPDGAKITDTMFEDCFKDKASNANDDTDDEASRYVSDDGRIVSVTYGEKTAAGTYAPYKTFILNYNNFSVQVVYNGVTYTIPAYSYVAVYHKN